MTPRFMNRLQRLFPVRSTTQRRSSTAAKRRRSFHEELERLETREVLTVTAAYALNVGPSIDADTLTSQPNATSLANGGFAISGTQNTQTDLDIFNAGGTNVGGMNGLTGTKSAVDELSNGNLVVVSQDSNSIRYSIRNSVGQSVLGSTDINDLDSSEADVAAADGSFWVVNQDTTLSNDADIDVRRYSNTGTLLGGDTIDSSGTANDARPRVAVLDNGNVAVAWHRVGFLGTQVWTAVFSSTGGTVKAPTLVDGTGLFNQNVDISSTPGGFAIVYEDSGWNTGNTDITMARFTNTGVFQGPFRNISNPTQLNSTSGESFPVVTRLANDLLVVGWERNLSGVANTDTLVYLVDPSTGNRLGTGRNVTAGEASTDDVEQITIAGSANGQINVFHRNATDNDVDGERLVGQRTSTSDSVGDTITGDAFIDIMHGNGGDDTLIGGANNDTLNGGVGNDTLNGGVGDDILNGGSDDDLLVGRDGADSLDGGPGVDTANYVASPAAVDINMLEGFGFGGDAQGDVLINIEKIIGSAFNDTIRGSGLTNFTLTGGDGDDILIGGAGSDTMSGGNGADLLTGSDGQDNLTGGANADQFIYTDVAQSPVGANRDRILDFFISQLDKINVSAIDARTSTAGVNPFQFIGSAAFTAEGQIRAVQQAAPNQANTVVEFNITGTNGAEMQLVLVNVVASTLALSDFIVAPGSSALASLRSSSGVASSPAKLSSGLTKSSSAATASPVLSGVTVADRTAIAIVSSSFNARTTGAVVQKKTTQTSSLGSSKSAASSSTQLQAIDNVFAEVSSGLVLGLT